MFCSGCGKEILAGTSFCRWCGKGSEVAQPAMQPAVTLHSTINPSTEARTKQTIRPWRVVGAVAIVGLLLIWALSRSDAPTSAPSVGASGSSASSPSANTLRDRRQSFIDKMRRSEQARFSLEQDGSLGITCFQAMTCIELGSALECGAGGECGTPDSKEHGPDVVRSIRAAGFDKAVLHLDNGFKYHIVDLTTGKLLSVADPSPVPPHQIPVTPDMTAYVAELNGATDKINADGQIHMYYSISKDGDLVVNCDSFALCLVAYTSFATSQIADTHGRSAQDVGFVCLKIRSADAAYPNNYTVLNLSTVR